MRWKACGKTDIGCVRSNNEDRFFIDNRSMIFMISDGMGGVEGGEVASAMVVTEFPRYLKQSLKKVSKISEESLQELIQEDVERVNSAVYQAGLNLKLEGMGATVVFLVIKNDTALLGHVGDSRCYRYNKNTFELTVETQDHVDDGSDHLLTRVMGMKEKVRADIRIFEIKSQDRLLLCSDGLNHCVTDANISKIMKQYTGLEQCQALIKEANDQGGEDNITVVTVSPR